MADDDEQRNTLKALIKEALDERDTEKQAKAEKDAEEAAKNAKPTGLLGMLLG